MNKETKDKIIKYFKEVNYDINSEVSKEFNKFKKLIIELPEFKDYFSIIENCCNKIENVFQEYNDGHIFKSFSLFEVMMKNIESNLNSIIIDNKTADDFLNKNFYRMRYSDNLLTSREEIFHIPLKKRRKVKLQRYNIPGLPALYLSSSIYTCWVEMDKPNIQDLHVSRFVLDKSKEYKILNLTMADPKRLFYKDKETADLINRDNLMYIERKKKQFLIDAMILWPLLFACSLKGSNKNDFYKPEYIIPQFLLEWSRSYKKIDGIAYLSVDLDTNNIDPYYGINYVFPIKNTNEDICSKLVNIFELTQPMRFDILENSYSENFYNSQDLSHRKFQNNEYKGYEIYYELTKYGKIEHYLEYFSTKKIECSKK
jgi:hypothetical protein